MKFAISIILILLISTSIVGIYPVYKMLQLHARALVQDRIANNAIKDVIIFHQSDQLCWENNGEEFSYQGHMYDVIHKDASSGNYYCLEDKYETKVLDQMSLAILQQTGNNIGHTAKHLLLLLFQVYTVVAIYSIGKRLLPLRLKSIHIHNLSFLDRLFKEIIAPPPEGMFV